MPTLISGSTGVNKITDGTVVNADMADDSIGIAELSATGTASSSTFLRGDNAWAAAGGGKVLQVVSSNSTTGTYPTTSFTAIASAEVTITPSATSSKILYIFACGSMVSDTVGNMSIQFKRDSTVVSEYERYLYNWQTDWVPSNFTFMSLDSPSTTSAVTYTLLAKEQYSAGGWEINDTVGSTSPIGSGVIAIEIGA